MTIPAALKRTYKDCSRVLATLGLADHTGPGVRGCDPARLHEARMDANETMAFARSLEHLKVELIEEKYPQLKSKLLLPAEQGVDPGATAFTWQRMARVGVFKFISARNATDLPRVEEYGIETTTPIRVIGGAYGWTTEELRNATKLGRPLPARKARMAREAYENKVDKVIALGDSVRGIPGAMVDSNVTILTAGITGGWLGAATALQMYDDLHTLANSVFTQSLTTMTPDTITLSPRLWSKINSKRMSDYDSRTVLQAFIESSTMVKTVDYWLPAQGAAANGTNDRAMVYRNSPDILTYIEPLPFQTLPPQAQGLSFLNPCEGKTGGAAIYQPGGIVYCDILN